MHVRRSVNEQLKRCVLGSAAPAVSAVTQGMAVLLQVPERIFVTDKLPKTATGKIQRRHMVSHFMGADKGGKGGGGGDGGVKKNPTAAAGAPAIRSKL